MMRFLYAFLIFGIFISCESRNEDDCSGKVFLETDSRDSVCLDLYTDIDTKEIVKITQASPKKVLLIFTGFAMPDNTIISRKSLSNSEIVSLLKQFTIIRLNVDNSNKRNAEDSLDIGNTNYRLQGSKFEQNTQPFHVFIDGNIKSIGTTLNYTPHNKEIIEFLEQ